MSERDMGRAAVDMVLLTLDWGGPLQTGINPAKTSYTLIFINRGFINSGSALHGWPCRKSHVPGDLEALFCG